MSGFAVPALALVVLGVYGMLAHAVAQRTRKLGIRVALGAHRREIVWLCLRRGLGRTATGLAIGTFGALAAGRLLAAALFGLAPWDPPTFAGALVILLAAGLSASAVPALRAANLDPVAALRRE